WYCYPVSLSYFVNVCVGWGVEPPTRGVIENTRCYTPIDVRIWLSLQVRLSHSRVCRWVLASNNPPILLHKHTSSVSQTWWLLAFGICIVYAIRVFSSNW
ncbi:unnamed protein product, partial [Laminaria digitata]